MNTSSTSPCDAQDFARLVDLQQQFSAATLELERIEGLMSRDALNAARAFGEDYIIWQERAAELEKQLNMLFTNHPEWRVGDAKSVKTPFGSVEQRKTSKLEVPNEKATVALIKQRALTDPRFADQKMFLHVEESPNLEALEAFTDDVLAELGITRLRTEKITVKPAKVQAAKVAKAAKKETA